jgi:hypothetical protein
MKCIRTTDNSLVYNMFFSKIEQALPFSSIGSLIQDGEYSYLHGKFQNDKGSHFWEYVHIPKNKPVPLLFDRTYCLSDIDTIILDLLL